MARRKHTPDRLAFDIFLLRLPVFFSYLRARFPPTSMPASVKAVSPIDFAVIAAYMLLMLGIGFYAMRFNRGRRTTSRGATASTGWPRAFPLS
jgi:hypothetical protein